MVDVVVTGRGVVTSIGEAPDAFFDALLHGASGIADGVGACVNFDAEPAMSANSCSPVASSNMPFRSISR